MIKLGTMYGKDVLLDTDDKKLADKALKRMEMLENEAQFFRDMQTKIEANNFLKR